MRKDAFLHTVFATFFCVETVFCMSKSVGSETPDGAFGFGILVVIFSVLTTFHVHHAAEYMEP